MNTFKTYFRIVKAKPWSFALPILIFATMIGLFMAATKDVDTDAVRINYAYMLKDEKPEGFDDLAAYLEEGGHVYPVEEEADLRMAVFDNVADFAFIVEDGKFTAIPQGPPEIRFAAMHRMQQFAGYRALYDKYDITDAEEKVDTLLERETTIETPTIEGKQGLVLLRQYFNFTAYVTLMAVFNIMIVVSTVFNKQEFLQRVMISRTPYDAIQRGVLGGHLVMVALVFLMIFGGSVLLHGADVVFGEAGLKMTLSFGIYLLCISLMGFFLTRVVRSMQVGTMITNVVALGMSFISGAFVPSEWLSDAVIKASKVFPMYWFLHGNELALEGSGDYWKSILVIGLMCVVLLFLIFIADFRKTRMAAA